MIDGLQILNIESADLSHLDWQSKVSHKTGEVSKKETAIYRSLHLTRYPNGRVKLSGSITSFINGNNTVNLNYDRLKEAINNLCNELNISANNTALNGFEMGLNVGLSYSPDEFLNDIIVWGKLEPLRWKGKNENYLQFSNSQLTLKIYSKSKQFDLSNNLLRFELRFDVMRYANKLGISNLSDLLNISKLKFLLNELITAFDDLIFYDSSIDLDTLKTTEKKILLKGNNPRYWSDKNLHRNTLLKNRKKFKSTVENHGNFKHHNIRKSLSGLSSKLIKKGVQNQQLSKSAYSEKSVQNHTLNNVCICTCRVTGLTKKVSGKNGKFLTSLDVQFYFENEPKTYKKLVANYLERTYKEIDYSNESLKKRFIEIAHRIRAVDYNKRNNTRNNTRRSINVILGRPNLFDCREFISDEKKELAGLNI